MTIYLEFDWYSTNKHVAQYLKEKELTVLHRRVVVPVVGDEFNLMPGMALRHRSGIIMRVMNRFPNYENLTYDYVLASASTKSEHLDLFRQ